MNPAEVKATVYQVSARNAAAMARAAAQAGGGTAYEPLPLPGVPTGASTFRARANVPGGDANKTHWEWAYVALEKRHADVVAENEMLFARSQSLERELREARATISHAIEREQSALRQLQQHGHQPLEQASRSVEEPRYDRGTPREQSTSARQSPRHEPSTSQNSPRHGRRAGQAAAPVSPRGGVAGVGASGVSMQEEAAAVGDGDDSDLVGFDEFRRITAEHDSKSYNARQLEARFNSTLPPQNQRLLALCVISQPASLTLSLAHAVRPPPSQTSQARTAA